MVGLEPSRVGHCPGCPWASRASRKGQTVGLEPDTRAHPGYPWASWNTGRG